MVFKYYSTQRPIDIGTYPNLPNDPQVEMTFFSGRQPVESGTVLAWGVLAYNAPLSPKQIEDYELRPARDNPDIKERMSVQAQAVGAWERRNHIPEEKRLTRWDPDSKTYEPLDSVRMEELQRQFEIALEFPTVPSRDRKKPSPQRGER